MAPAGDGVEARRSGDGEDGAGAEDGAEGVGDAHAELAAGVIRHRGGDGVTLGGRARNVERDKEQADNAEQKDGRFAWLPVVKLAQAAGDMQRSGPAHAVGRTFNQRVKGERAIEAALERRTGGFFGNAQVGRFHDPCAFKISG